MYAARDSAPSVEDVGDSLFVAGRAHVTIDPAFAKTMARTSAYHVFLTPEGSSRSVFLANRTLTGFDIVENAAGTSDVDVKYAA